MMTFLSFLYLQVNLESLPNWEEKQMFKQYVFSLILGVRHLLKPGNATCNSWNFNLIYLFSLFIFLLRFNEYNGFSDLGICTGSWKTITRLLFPLKSKLKIHNVCLCCVKIYSQIGKLE